jgi:hypothetical protein
MTRMKIRLQTFLYFVTRKLHFVMWCWRTVITRDRIPTLLVFGLSRHSPASMEPEGLAQLMKSAAEFCFCLDRSSVPLEVGPLSRQGASSG